MRKCRGTTIVKSVHLKDFTHLAFMVLVICTIILSSCGIEEYVYFAPVTNPTYSFTEERTRFILPGLSIQDQNYCTDYVLYYRIYRSEVDIPISSSSDFSEVNSQLIKDYNSITTNTDDESKILSSISYLEANFYQTSFYSPSLDPQLELEDDTKYEILSKDYLAADFYGAQFEIDFQLTATSYFHPVITYYEPGGVNVVGVFRIVREYLSDIAPGRDFLYSSQISGSDTVPYSNLVEGSYAYVLFYISAHGINKAELSTVYSAPCYLGVFRIDDI